MSRPWMPLYVADYLADTGHLSTIEHGAYLLLIMHYWAKGNLPDDDKRLASIARASLEQWSDMRSTIAEFFGPGWKHERIDQELESAEKAYERRASAGRAGGKAKAEAKQSSSNATAMPQQSHSHSHIRTDATASGAIAPITPRDELWSDGVSTLKSMTGKTEGASRQMVGKWLKDASDDCALVLSKIRTARAEKIGEPVAWITAAVKPPPKPMSIGEMFREDARQQGIIPHEQPTSNTDRRLVDSDGGRQDGGSGIARRFAITGNEFGRLG